MACTTSHRPASTCTQTPVKGDDLLPLDRLEEIDTTLYHFEHMCALLSAFASHGNAIFTDGMKREHYAVVFGWIEDELHDVRRGLNEVHKWVAQS